MSDGMYLLLAATVAVVFVVVVLGTNPPEGRNPHVDARRQRRWWRAITTDPTIHTSKKGKL